MKRRKKIGKRISFAEDKRSLDLIIEQKTNPINAILIGIWCLSMGFVTIVFLYYFMNPDKNMEAWGFGIIGGLAMYFFYRSAKVLTWRLIGKEIIHLNEDKFTLRNSFGILGRTYTLQPEKISRLELLPYDYTKFMQFLDRSSYVIGGDAIELSHAGKTYRFAKQVEEKDAKLMLRLIDKHLKDIVKAKKSKQ